MKYSIISFFLNAILFINSYGQVKDATSNLKQQAGNMGAAFVSGDYATFAKYTYPEILAAMGGTNRMTESLKRSNASMKGQGMTISNITFDEPSKIVKSGKESQATIAQHTEIKLSQGRIVNTSTLIAISTDNGVNWTFIDTSNKDMTTLRKALPNLSPGIIIPPSSPPIRYSN